MSQHSLVAAVSFDTISVAGILLRLDGTIIAANRAALRIAERELVGATMTALSPSVGARWTALVLAASEHGEAVDETMLEVPSGRKHLQFLLSLVEHEGEQYVQTYAFDITERKAAEEAARVGRDTDERMAAQQRLESLGLVAGGIAHDYNNLLVGVLAEASAAREDRNLGEGTREALRRIEAAARRMAQLTRQLLAYSGRGQFVTIPVAADELVTELREQLTRVVRPAVRLEIATTADAAVVEADPGLLRQVVMNLVANASDAAGTRVDVSTRVISRDGAPYWQLEIRDDGAGIDNATIARIFEPFFSTKPGHHGLGLSAVHGIVRRLSGDVEVDTRVGEGSRFRVHIPIALGAEPAPRQPDASLTSMQIPKLTGMRVLVADDEPSVRATVRRLLERRGATVVVASDGTEAESRLRDEQFNLVVSDVSMPGCTGYDVLVIARATQPGIRVVLMSGYTEKLRGEGGEEEPDAFLEKPFTAKVLDATIDEVLKGKG
ncbi:MAG: ATP-binding protein [Kofleriaceae bacterium]